LTRRLRVGVVQTTTGIDLARNAGTIATALQLVAGQGAAIAFTPEMSGLLDRDRERMRSRVSDEANEPTLAAARAVAVATGMWVALGSLAVHTGAKDGRLANRSFLIDGAGEIVARYDKIHLFDVDLGPGERYRESASYVPGDRAVVARTPRTKLGLSVCYDVRFPALYTVLAHGGAEVIAVPAAFTVPTGRAHWHTLLRARAIETGAFVVAAAQSDHHEDGRDTYGHSLVIDPWGEVLLDMGEGAGTAVVDLDLTAIASARARLPTLDHAREFGLP